MPRFVNLQSRSALLVCDLRGVRRHIGTYSRRGQGLSADFRNFDEHETARSPNCTQAFAPRGLSPYILGRIRQLIETYRKSGRFTDIEIQTIDALLYEGLSLRQLANREGVTDEAVRARLIGRRGRGGLLKKAPEFAKWWRFACSWRKRGRRS